MGNEWKWIEYKKWVASTKEGPWGGLIIQKEWEGWEWEWNRKTTKAKVSGTRGKGRLRKAWLDGVDLQKPVNSLKSKNQIHEVVHYKDIVCKGREVWRGIRNVVSINYIE